MPVAWYRFVTTFGRRRSGYLTLILLIGLIGGIAMGSVAAARRTQSSYATFLASTSPSDLGLSVQGQNLTAKLARLPGVQRVEAALLSLNAFPLSKTGDPDHPGRLPVQPGHPDRQHQRRVLRPGPGHGDRRPDGEPGPRG